MRPFVKLTSSRICDIKSHPARRRAGVMNLVQMSRSLSVRLSIQPGTNPLGFPKTRWHYSLKFKSGTGCNTREKALPIKGRRNGRDHHRHHRRGLRFDTMTATPSMRSFNSRPRR
jgi:hypothetical protein